MLNWLKSLLAPVSIADPVIEVSGAHGVLDILKQALQIEACPWRMENGELVLSNGLTVTVEFLESQRFDGGGMRTSSKITCRHPIHFPGGLFEFQHASGSTEQASLLSGFQTWVQTDLLTLNDAIADASESCLVMTMPWQPDGGGPELKRRIYMGPFIHDAADPVQETDSRNEGDDFCPCCLFTKSFDAFRPQLHSHGFFGLRLYAARHADGTIVADCRVNGEAYPSGLEQLKKYAETWPQRGMEIRKQYVAIRTVN